MSIKKYRLKEGYHIEIDDGGDIHFRYRNQVDYCFSNRALEEVPPSLEKKFIAICKTGKVDIFDYGMFGNNSFYYDGKWRDGIKSSMSFFIDILYKGLCETDEK